ncbi:MAG: choice-of-anchor D domain-containing protein [Terracidiphilus sp.]
MRVNLRSDKAAVAVPATVTVPANATEAHFTVHVSAVRETQTATLTAALDGGSKSAVLKLIAATRTLSASTNSEAFSHVSLNTLVSRPVKLTSTGTEPITITRAAVSGRGFTVSGAGFPLTLDPGKAVTLSVRFKPLAPGASAGRLTVTSNSTASPATEIALTGTADAPALSAFYCSVAAISGSAADICTVKVASASSVNIGVTLSSNNAAVVVPATVTVPANATSAQLTANVSSVLTNQTATLEATSGSSSLSDSLQLNAATRTLSASAAGLAYSYVALNTAVTQSVTLTSSGTEPITLNAARVTGAGFTVSGATFPLTLNPYQAVTLSVQFDPVAAGTATGQLAVTSNSTASATTVIGLSGIGGNPALSAFYCSISSLSGSGTDICTVKLSSTSTASVSVNLSSNNSAVAAPATVTFPANATSAQFTVNFSAVLTTQTATLEATVAKSSMSVALQLNAYTRTLSTSAASLAFNYVALNATAFQSVTLKSTGTEAITISATAAGPGFTVSGATFPLSLSPYQTVTLSVHFDPVAAGTATGQVTITSNSTASTTTTIALSGIGGVPPLSAFYCATATVKGSATDTCTVKLSSVSTGGGVSVSLSSNDSAAMVPATVTVPADATSAQFTANMNSVLTTQTATLKAVSGSSSMSFAVQLNAANQTLGASTAAVAFPYVALDTPATLPVTLTSTGTDPITISAAAATGAGFTVSGATLPVTLNPDQKLTLNVQFDPATAGAATGELTITSNSTASSTLTVGLSGIGGVPPLSAFYCTSATMLGSGTDTCTVKLSTVSADNVSIGLSSGNAAVTVPATVTVPANATMAQFTASVKSVTTTQTATLGASAGSSSMSFALQLNAWTQTMSVSAGSLSFEDVVVDTAVTKSVALNSTGTEPITISAASVTGAGFTVSGATVPLTLNPGQTATLSVRFSPTATGTATGQLTIASNSTSGSPAVVGLSGSAVLGPNGSGTPETPFSYAGSTLVSTWIPPNPSAAISPDLFGLTITNLAPNSLEAEQYPTPFPTFPVSTLRFWDVAYWAMIQPAEGDWNWIKMDNSLAIAQQNGVSDFIFNFGRPPAWASTNPTDPCTNGEGAGTCDPPDMDAFETFATAVVQRYCGKVKYYEPWNEPDNPEFWDGNNSQMLAIAQQVYQIAKDPANCGCTNGVCAPNGGANPNKVLLPPISGVSQTSLNWLGSYLAAGGSQYPYADVAAYHGYGFIDPEDMVTGPQPQLFEQTLASYGLSNLPVWNTEASFEWDTNLSQDQQASWVMRYHVAQALLGTSRFIWYAYDNCSWGTLWTSPNCTTDEGPAGDLTEAGTAYSTIESWLLAANLTQCQEYQDGLWACELLRSGGYNAWMLWSSTGTSISVTIPANLGLTVYRDWQNNLATLPTEISVTQMPVLLENQDL